MTASNEHLVHTPAYGPPPAYTEKSAATGSRWNPKNWSRKLLIGVIVAAILIIAAIVIGAVLGTKNSGSYPDYSRLTYTLEDEYSGTGFFDDFDYFTGYDPSSGFVQYVQQSFYST